jgi:hypothetical protein
MNRFPRFLVVAWIRFYRLEPFFQKKLNSVRGINSFACTIFARTLPSSYGIE